MRWKGRGAQNSLSNTFDALQYERVWLDNDFEDYQKNPKTNYQVVYPKSIVNKVNSPDVALNYTLNPYQGCEHGCIYCFARNSHEYWGFDAGIGFEQNILIKRNAPDLLRKHLQNKKWQAQPILLSGNTDCYQPIERKEAITRQLLQLFLQFKHPVAILTKNSLIQRDIDLLQQLAQDDLVKVLLSITSLDNEIRQRLEPRTSSIQNKLKTMQLLHERNIPVQVMIGPIIPGLNDHEIFAIAQAASEHGAQGMAHTIIRLNGQLGPLFTQWIHQAFPLKADKTLNLIKQLHKGQLNNSTWGERKTGTGKIAEVIQQQLQLARKRFFSEKNQSFTFNLELHQFHKTNQLNLFGPL